MGRARVFRGSAAVSVTVQALIIFFCGSPCVGENSDAVVSGRLRIGLASDRVRISSDRIASEALRTWSFDLTLGTKDVGAVSPGDPAGSPAAVSVLYRARGITTTVREADGLALRSVLTDPSGSTTGDDAVAVRVGVALAGDVKAVRSKAGDRLTFATERGVPLLLVSDLDAVDDTGRDLSVRIAFTPSPGDPAMGEIAFVIDAPDARYPLSVSWRLSAGDRVEDSPWPSLRSVGSDATDDHLVSATFAPPLNDTCEGAEVIPPFGPFPHLSAITDITDATDPGDPPPMAGCPIGIPGLSRGIWYRFTPASSGFYTISDCADGPTASTVNDTILDVYTSSTGECDGTMTPVACDDDACVGGNYQSKVSLSMTSGTTYFILVQQWGSVAPPPNRAAIQLRVAFTTIPVNDACGGAIPLTVGIPRVGSTMGAANDFTLPSGSPCFSLPSPPNPVGNSAVTATGRDVVYSFTAPATGRYSFRVADVSGDVLVYAAQTCAPGSLATPPCVGAAQRHTTGAEEVMCLNMTGGSSVFVFVDGTSLTAGTDFTIEASACAREEETNSAIATANPLSGTCGLETSAATDSDVDFFSLGTVAADSRIFVMTDGQASNNPDAQLRITSSLDTYEFDDDDGDLRYGDRNSVIAGTRFSPGGTAYLRFNPKQGLTHSEPHRIYQVVQPPASTAVAETEPNGSGDPPNAASSNYFSGTTSTSDQDDFGFHAAAGDIIFVAADTDPDYDGTATDVAIGLLDPLGTLVAQVNGSAAVSSTRAPVPGSLTGTTPVAPGEGLVHRARIGGTYTAFIMAVAPGPGNYLMSISKNCLAGGGGLASTDASPAIGKVVLELFPAYFPNVHGPEVIRLRQSGSDAVMTRDPQIASSIASELVQMSLTGASPSIGPVNVAESPGRASLGAIAVTGPGDPVSGDAFFDVFVEIQVNGKLLVNDEPFHVHTHLAELPPHDRLWKSPFSHPVNLYDVTDPPPGGAPRGQLLYEELHMDPELPAADTDCFETSFTGVLQLFAPLPSYSGQISATGITQVRRASPTSFPPGPQTVDTAIDLLDLSGSNPVLGPFQVALNEAPGWYFSLGRVTGQPARAFPADAFFDVFFRLEMPGSVGTLVTGQSQVLGHPDGGADLEATASLGNSLGTLPPGVGQFHAQPAGQITHLFRPTNLATPVGQLSQMRHTVVGVASCPPAPSPERACFQSTLSARVTIFPPFVPGGCTESLALSGPFKVWSGNAYDPGDGRTIVPTVVACTEVTGSSGSCGLGTVTARPSRTIASSGQVRAFASGETFPAESFFDVFVELETAMGPLHTSAASRVDATVDSLPLAAETVFYGPGAAVPIFNASNVQVGTIEILTHALDAAVDCPCSCEPSLRVAPDKSTIDVGIVRGGAGVAYDVVKGLVSNGAIDWIGAFSSSTCLGADVPSPASDASSPAPNQLFWYVSRDSAFGQGSGTYNGCPASFQPGNRDFLIPPATCP